MIWSYTQFLLIGVFTVYWVFIQFMSLFKPQRCKKPLNIERFELWPLADLCRTTSIPDSCRIAVFSGYRFRKYPVQNNNSNHKNHQVILVSPNFPIRFIEPINKSKFTRQSCCWMLISTFMFFSLRMRVLASLVTCQNSPKKISVTLPFGRQSNLLPVQSRDQLPPPHQAGCHKSLLQWRNPKFWCGTCQVYHRLLRA